MTTPPPARGDEPVDACETPQDAARRFAGELERLREGLTTRLDAAGIDPADLTGPLPIGEWPVTAALAAISVLYADLDQTRISLALTRDDYGHACKTIAAMHAAAVGEVRGPSVDPVADVRRLRELAYGRPAPAPAAAADDRIDARAVLPHLEHVRDDPAAVPGEALRADMRRIAQLFRGIAYDPDDRPSEVLAVRRAAIEAGLIPVPDPDLLRTYRGTTPPEPPAPEPPVEAPDATPGGDPVGVTLRFAPVELHIPLPYADRAAPAEIGQHIAEAVLNPIASMMQQLAHAGGAAVTAVVTDAYHRGRADAAGQQFDVARTALQEIDLIVGNVAELDVADCRRIRAILRAALNRGGERG